jgi:hypothetical protein
MEFKTVVDTLASTASLAAIISVSVGWYRSCRKPLTVKKVVIHREDEYSTFIIVTENRQNYPVTITRLDCYKRKIYEVMKRNERFPEYSEHLSSKEVIFNNSNAFEVPAMAYTDLRIKVMGSPEIPKSLIFSMDTSHGYHELTCKDIAVVDIGKVEIFSAEYKDEYSSKIHAKLIYYMKVLKELIGIGLPITEEPSHTTRRTDLVPRRFGWYE